MALIGHSHVAATWVVSALTEEILLRYAQARASFFGALPIVGTCSGCDTGLAERISASLAGTE